ncbi:MAG: NAD-dependent epimerase/dehydratase family protein, partial [Flavobacteriales bacterium]
MEKQDKIYIAGHRGMVGSAIVRRLQKDGFNNIVARTSSELDLKDQAAVRDFFQKEKPDHVVLAAAKVGGIQANNTYRAQ